jgi:dihydroorotase
LGARDMELLQIAGGRYHVAHISTARTAELVRDAKRRGLPVTCEVTPHHLTLTDAACGCYDTATKVAPPLRSSADVTALKEALADGTIDAIATDHAPHSPVEKDTEFDNASFGMIGLETALPLVLELVRERVLDLGRAIALLTHRPAAVFGLPAGTLAAGGPADLAVLDLDRRWTVDRGKMRSKSRNTPFHGREVRGRAVLTFAFGKPAHDEDGALK